MAGIYVHIPFCKQACIYCDFHFSTSTLRMDEMANSIAKEVAIRKDYLAGEKIETLYFGGGTPSIMSPVNLEKLLKQLYNHFQFSDDLEFTFESNPDDLQHNQLASLMSLGVNRLSIGLQALDDAILKWMNRAHNTEQGIAAIKAAQRCGINNISIDLIYGRPGLKRSDWENEIDRVIELGVPHISAYCLTVEPRTVLGKRVENKQEKPIDEEAAASQFELLIEKLAQVGVEQYEVSNFAKPGFYSRHNTAYWQGIPYLGLGPSAHSFNGKQRAWNVANNSGYLKSISSGILPLEVEIPGPYDRLNEWIMTSLRTKWGLDLRLAKTKFDFDLGAHYHAEIEHLIAQGLAERYENTLRLTRSGLFRADGIAADFFVV